MSMTADYRRVAEAISYLRARRTEQPSLDDVAEHIGLSPYHFQRLFRRFAGVSPKRFVQFLTAEHAKRLLQESRSVLDTTYSVGLSGPGRLHDLFVSVEAVTPGEFKRRGAGLTIRHGVHPTPLGDCLIGITERGVCDLSFVDGDLESAVAELRARWQGACTLDDSAATRPVAATIFDSAQRHEPLPLLLRGTNFQIKVWNALLRIPEGAILSYGGLADQLDLPTSARAVASAVARNRVGYLVPCHRVLRESGEITGYRWDPIRKRAMLAREFAARTAVAR